MDLKSQRRMASEIMKTGVNRVWVDPSESAKISEAITKQDVRLLISNGLLRALPVQGVSKARAKIIKEQKKKGRQKGQGSRKGTKNTRTPKKETWMKAIRAIRKELKSLRESEKITVPEYRRLYTWATAGRIKDKAYLKLQIKKLRE